MAIQKSVLSNDIIGTFLIAQYNISPNSIANMSLGTANCYRISAAQGEYFLKEYQETFSESDLKQEIELNNYLINSSFPTAKIVSDKNGNYYSFFKDRFISVQEFVSGVSYVNHDLPDGFLYQAAEILGKLHNTLKNYGLPTDMGCDWVNDLDIKKALCAYDELIELANTVEGSEIQHRIKDDLLFKKNLIDRVASYGQCFKKLTYKSTHGDYTAMQFLCDKNGIKAVIDFSSARKLPAVWEIMRSYTQSAADCANPFDFDVNKFCEYVRVYMNCSCLTEYDLKYMPYAYLYQLARSRYGYKHYMRNTENKDELLKFACWRTDVCRMLSRKADEISERLVKLV